MEFTWCRHVKEVWGGIYIGDYKNNKQMARGIYFLKSGTIFEGDFKND